MTPEDRLQALLEELETGGANVEALVAHDAQARGLEGELRAAKALQQLAALQPSPAANQAWEAKLRTLAQAQAARQRPATRPGQRLRPPVSLRWAGVLATVLLMSLAGFGVVNAAGASVPGDLLYPVKRTTEAFQVGVTPPQRQAALHLSLAQARQAELARLTERGAVTAAHLETLAAEMRAEIDQALAWVQAAPVATQGPLLGALQIAVREQQATVVAAVDAIVAADATTAIVATSAAAVSSAYAAAQTQAAAAGAQLTHLAPTLTPGAQGTAGSVTGPAPTARPPLPTTTRTPSQTAQPSATPSSSPVATPTPVPPTATRVSTDRPSPVPSTATQPSQPTVTVSVPTTLAPLATWTAAPTDNPPALPVPTATLLPTTEARLLICHRPPGNPDNGQTLDVLASQWPAHEAHGDSLGPCP